MIIEVQPDGMFSLTREPAFAFFYESKLAGELDFSHFCQTWGTLISLDMARLFVYRTEDRTLGIIGGTITKCTMTGDLIAQESFWWVHPGIRASPIGIRLFRKWENRVIEDGAKRIYVGNLLAVNHEKMTSLYSALGYQMIETHYVRPV